jgi:hypothetical protein
MDAVAGYRNCCLPNDFTVGDTDSSAVERSIRIAGPLDLSAYCTLRSQHHHHPRGN